MANLGEGRHVKLEAASTPESSPSHKLKTSPSSPPAAWKSLVAGASAGAIEGGLTYPFEYAKTMLQFGPDNTISSSSPIVSTMKSRNPLVLIYTTARNHGVSSLYVGCTSLVVGTAAKAAVRFLAFDNLKGLLVDERGQLSAGRGIMAGMGAGVMESLLAVTPFETVKTALIQDGKSTNPRFRGLIHGSVTLIKERGIGGVYQGATAVTLRQGANSAVRMGSYSWLKGLVQARQENKTAPLSSSKTFGIGAVAGVITVYATMPFDTVKTRMQSLQAREQYRSTLDCGFKILRHEGVKTLWSGSTARLGRLVFSGGIVFTVYEEIMKILKPLGT